MSPRNPTQLYTPPAAQSARPGYGMPLPGQNAPPAGAPQVDPVRGAVLASLSTPAAGSLAPQISLSYSSRPDPEPSPFGNGWMFPYARSVVSISSTAADIASGQSVTRYTNQTGGVYEAPPTSQNSLAIDGTGWRETQPDGGYYLYDSSGRLTAQHNPAGQIWTFTYSGSLLSSIEDPFSRLTTLTYSSGKIRSITDVASRTTTFTVDMNGNLTETLTPELCQTQFGYSYAGSAWRLSRHVDSGGNVTTYSYDYTSLANDPDAYRVGKVQNPLSQVTTFNYSTQATYSASALGPFQTKVTDPRGNVSTIVYDGQFQITNITNAKSETATYTWDAQYQLQRSEDPSGEITTFSYTTLPNGVTQVSGVVSPAGDLTTYTFDNDSRLKASIDPLGNRTTYTWNANNQRTAVMDARGNVTSFSYSSLGPVQSVTDPLGNVTTYVYDNLTGEQIASVNPLGKRTTYTYNALGQQVAVNTPRGNVWTTTYDLVNRRRTSVDPLGAVTTFNYGTNCRLQSTVNPVGAVTTNLYDSLNRVVATVDPLGHRTTQGYDAAGNQISVTNPLGYVTTSTFDAANRLRTTMNPLGFVTTYGYDHAGRPVSTQDANGYVTTTVYDTSNHRTATINALGYRTTQVLDALEQRIAVVDANSQRTTFQYDAVGNQVASVDPLGRRTTSTCDAANRQQTRTDARGVVTTYGYDAAGQLTTRRYPHDPTVTFAYDDDGNRFIMRDATGFQSVYAYDAAGRLSQVSQALRITAYSYDANGRRRTMSYSGHGTFSYTYDLADQLYTLVNPAGDRTTFTYDAVGQKDIVFGTALNRAYSFDEVGRLTQLVNSSIAGSTLAQNSYDYDNVGNRIHVMDDDGATSLAYDSTYQLLVEERTGISSYTTTYAYDRVGNCLKKVTDGAITTYTYDEASQISLSIAPSGGFAVYNYDLAGNVSVQDEPAGVTTSTWSDENYRTKVVLPNADVVTSVFNGDGLRYLKQTASGDRCFVWDENRYFLEKPAPTESPDVEYSQEPAGYGGLVSQRRLSGGVWTPSYYALDGLGSTIALVDSSSTVTDSYRYDVFGNPLLTTGSTTNPFRWIGSLGYYYDEELLEYYLRARTYNPSLARFLSQDPMGFGGGDWNLYRYVINNPANGVDPSGLGLWSWICSWFTSPPPPPPQGPPRFPSQPGGCSFSDRASCHKCCTQIAFPTPAHSAICASICNRRAGSSGCSEFAARSQAACRIMGNVNVLECYEVAYQMCRVACAESQCESISHS